MENTFHEGERKVQERIGETLIANNNGRLITNTIIKGAIPFIEKQPMVIVTTSDENQNVWASILIGNYGFVKVPNSNALSFDLNEICSDKNDVFYENISNGSQIGTLFIELATRRRFRINGISSFKNNKIEVSIVEAYPNCPKYIQQRIIHNPDTFQNVNPQKEKGTVLNQTLNDWILNADTFFLGSYSNEGRMDASHRGGKSGFIEILDSTSIKIPDYPGNSLYNTLGNIAQNSKTGLLFIDFKNKRTLQFTGSAKLLFDQTSEEDIEKTGGTGRYWVFKILKWVVTNQQHNVNWEFTGYSPFNPQ